MDELTCFSCQTHVGWVTSSGPMGLVFCDSCYEDQLEEEDE